MNAYFAERRGVSACVQPAIAAPARWCTDTSKDEARDLQALGVGACRTLAATGTMSACVLLAGSDSGWTTIARHGVNCDHFTAHVDRARVRAAIAGALATGEAALFHDEQLIVVPLVDAATAAGVLVGRLHRTAAPPGPSLLAALATTGRFIALAMREHLSALRRERARERSARLRVAADLHETVVQRLCGISLVLSADEPLQPRDQRECRDAVQQALRELRGRLVRAADLAEDSCPSLADELRALGDEPDVHVTVTGGQPQLSARQDAATRTVLHEAVCNARKHAGSPIRVAVHTDRDLVRLGVSSDGAAACGAPGAPGIGLKLVAAAALEADGILGLGPTEAGEWHVQLTVPHAAQAS